MLSIADLEQLMNRGDYVELHPDGTTTIAKRDGLKQELEELRLKHAATVNELAEMRTLLNTPEIEDFDKAVPLEAAHQIQRWSAAHDAGKNPSDWFWLVGYLAGKALTAAIAGNTEKAKHHCISTAAALRNWHAHIRSGVSAMRPGIEEPKGASNG
jgi:hypothetical protein